MSFAVGDGFRAALLPRKLLQAPLNSSAPEIFQMDICRRWRGEYFRIWSGGAGNAIAVLATDAARRQLILSVREPARRYEERLPRHRRTYPLEPLPKPRHEAVLYETRDAWVVERWTPSEERRFLCGRDERHLFVARVGDVTTVAEGHDFLRPPDVRAAERDGGSAALRQGEWFFVAIAPGEEDALYDRLWAEPTARSPNALLEDRPRGHRVSELVRFDGRTYARGQVRHPDHRTLPLDRWHRVFRNAEPQPTWWEQARIRWID
jgi:hypothetical protein